MSAVRRLSTLLACLAILLQTFLVQTHVHGLNGLDARPSIGSTAAGARAVQPPAVQLTNPSDDAQAPCVICQTLASAGNALVTQAPSLAPIVQALVRDPPIAIERITTRPSHAWRSRAPPISL